MSFVDKIKDALSNKDEKEAADNAANSAAEAMKKVEEEQKRQEAEAAEKQRLEAEEAERKAAEARAEEERRAAEAESARRAEEERRAAEAAAKPKLSVGRVREVVAHDSSPSTPTGQGMDKELGMLLESALRRALDQVGLPNRNKDDGSLGTMFLESYSRWQGHLGYSGNDADGVPGRESLQKLAEATGMFDVID